MMGLIAILSLNDAQHNVTGHYAIKCNDNWHCYTCNLGSFCETNHIGTNSVLIMNDFQHNDTQHNVMLSVAVFRNEHCYAERRYTDCRGAFSWARPLTRSGADPINTFLS
jgi:hypothetical protein